MDKYKDDFIQRNSDFGKEILELIKALYPICRSITGNGVRETLKILKQELPLEIHEIPTNTICFDWKIPREWNIKNAYILDPNGKKILDFQNSNIHVVSYSTPIHKKMPLNELKQHLHYLPDQPDSIPYRTSYYNDYWGFCITYNQFNELVDNGEYEVFIDSSLKDGSLTYGEYFKPGKIKDEVLFSCYVCHPSLCNDNLSGVCLLTILGKILDKIPTKFSYRFLFIPETIGAIAWLSQNENKIHNIKHGLVATCLGDNGISTYKKTRDGNNLIDKIVEQVLKNSDEPYKILDFWPLGSDERQFCSPGFNLPMGSLMRTVYDTFDEYHTSKDNLDFMNVNALTNSLSKYFEVIYQLEKYNVDSHDAPITKTLKISQSHDPVFISQNMKCEPHLGKRNLYHKIGALTNQNIFETKRAIQWIMNCSDGYTSLSDIAKKSGLDSTLLMDAANLLKNVNLLRIS